MLVSRGIFCFPSLVARERTGVERAFHNNQFHQARAFIKHPLPQESRRETDEARGPSAHPHLRDKGLAIIYL